MNAGSADDAIDCNQFNHQLTNEICFEDRTEGFKYTNVLQDKAFVERLVKWLNYTRPERDFFFCDTIDEYDDFNINCYMLTAKWYSGNKCEYFELDAWMEDFNDLKNNLLPKRLSELI